MKYFYEIDNTQIRLYINGKKLLSQTRSEIDPNFLRWFISQALKDS